MDKIKVLSKNRGTLRASVTKLINTIKENIELNNEDPAIEDSLALLIDKEKQLIEIDKEICGLIKDEKELDKEIDSTMIYRDDIVLCKSKVTRYIRKLHATNESKQDVSNSKEQIEINEVTDKNQKVNSFGVNLPKLSINKFRGDVCEWQNFWAQYQSAIHDNETLKEVEKFNYLKTLLTDSALTSISGLPLIAENYTKAVKILTDRFGKRENLISAFMNNLLNIEPVRRSDDLKALRNLYDNLEIQIRSLESLKVTADSYGCLLCPLLLKAIPKDLVLEFNRKKDSESETSITDILNYLRKEIESREQTFSQSVQKQSKTFPTPVSKFIYPRHKEITNRFERNNLPAAASLNVNTVNRKCLFCNSKEHTPDQCSMSVDEKRNSLRNAGRCFKCLAKYHIASKCEKKIKCKNCNRDNHNTAFCLAPTNEDALKETVVSSVTEIKTQSCASYLLQTVRARIINKMTGRSQNVRVLLDLGSQRSFLINDVYAKLDLPIVGQEEIKIFGFGSSCSTAQKINRVDLVLQSIEENDINVKIEALVTPVISEASIQLPGYEITELCKKKGIRLTENFNRKNESLKISLLLGADFYWSVVKNRVRRLSNSLVAVDTKLGWVISGSENMYATSTSTVNNLNVVVADTNKIEDATTSELIKKFWDLETMGITHYESDNNNKLENDLILDNFGQSVEFKDGRYIVCFPWNHNESELSDNLEVAKTRFKGLIRKFKRDPNFYERYRNVIDQYLQEGIAEESDLETTGKTYFMPHQAVIREDRDTTKLRVVYDASSHAENSMSLNDCLDIGPNMYPEILHLLLRFRENRIAITADIQQAFLQISLAEKDRDAVKFLWKDDLDNSEPKALRMTRVIFGAKSSPFLLGATLKVHIEKYQIQYPKEVALLKESLYVDDLIAGTDTADEALRFCVIIKDIMKQGNFNMRKWKTNDETVQRIWNLEDDVVDEPSYCKVLGYLWNKSQDTFSIDVKGIEKENEKCRTEVTKREVLSIIGRLYDPIGFLNPFTIKARILLQEIWKRGILWEAALPEELFIPWKDWCDEISFISNIEIHRHQFEGIRKENIQNLIHLHCFCDASQKAYGAVLYLRYEVDGRFHTSFVTSKSRVAPLKKLSIPRLELMGALTGSRLVKYVEKAFKDLKLVKHFWTDSKIILHWIQSDPKKWKPFVKNRVIEIQKNAPPETWRHCPGSENPADLLSRGEKIENLENNSLWWTGPAWLKESEENILAPEEIEVDSSECIDEELRKSYKEITTNACITHSTDDLFQIQNYSNLTKIYRITAWCLRYLNNLRNSTKLSGPLATEEIESAEKYWIKRIQNEHFQEEITSLKENKPLRPESRIKTLNPFLDEDGIVRVGGRLQNSNLQFREAHPIVLPDKGHFIDLIIMYNHKIVGHGGIADTLCQIRENFWLLRSRKKIKNVLYNCHTCKKFRVKPIEQDMAPLPPDRCREAFPFEITGLDYAGPLYVKDGKDHVKGYVLLFTCAVTRAVHLELTSDMTTETFLLAFRRFIARRGLCKVIFSDNAKTFKTAKKEIDLLNQSMKGAQDYFAQKAIQWKFIIEKAAWWGGFWERVVKSIKTCLRRILGRSSLTYRELEAVLLEVEAILNSRPLTFVYSDQAEPEPLTPGHFLIGRRLLSLPSYQTATHITPTNFHRRWKHQELMTQRLWKVWKHTYLMDLRSAHHNKMIGKGSDLQEGELVLVHEEKLPRLMWKMGRVIKTFVGRDKKVRACAVRLPNGKEIRRPVQLLFPLELTLGKNIRLSGPEDVPAAQQTDRGRERLDNIGREKRDRNGTEP